MLLLRSNSLLGFLPLLDAAVVTSHLANREDRFWLLGVAARALSIFYASPPVVVANSHAPSAVVKEGPGVKCDM